MPVCEPDPEIEARRLKLPCGCMVTLVVSQQVQCLHNDGHYPHHELDLEYVPCDCEDGCERCNGHGYVYKRRTRA